MDALPGPLETALTAQEGTVSGARMRQLRWIAGEMAAAATEVDRQDRPGSPRAWFSAPFVPAYLALADAGALRRRASAHAGGRPASARVRRTCLRILAGPHAPALPDLALPRLEPPGERALPEALDAAVGRLVTRASSPGAPAALVRAAALTAVVADTRMRVGELAAVRVADLDLDAARGATVTWTPRPQPAGPPPRSRRARAGSGRAPWRR